MNILLSYPRSGNHLARFFIELLTERPTYGRAAIYENEFSKEIPFNIRKGNQNFIYSQCHYILEQTNKDLIFIIRNPKEVLLRHCNLRFDIKNYEKYFDVIIQYHEHKGKKIMFFYEDILTNKEQFIKDLNNFLECKNKKKLKYVLDNLNELWELSLNPKNRVWGGNKSKQSLNYYYQQLGDKEKFNNYLKNKLKNPDFKFLIDKYGNI